MTHEGEGSQDRRIELLHKAGKALALHALEIIANQGERRFEQFDGPLIPDEDGQNQRVFTPSAGPGSPWVFISRLLDLENFDFPSGTLDYFLEDIKHQGFTPPLILVSIINEPTETQYGIWQTEDGPTRANSYYVTNDEEARYYGFDMTYAIDPVTGKVLRLAALYVDDDPYIELELDSVDEANLNPPSELQFHTRYEPVDDLLVQKQVVEVTNPNELEAIGAALGLISSHTLSPQVPGSVDLSE